MITVNVEKAKQDSHAHRKAHRDLAMKPHDVKITINEGRIKYMPDGSEKDLLIAENVALEAERQKVREANMIIQSDIDKAGDNDDADAMAKIKNSLVTEMKVMSEDQK